MQVPASNQSQCSMAQNNPLPYAMGGLSTEAPMSVQPTYMEGKHEVLEVLLECYLQELVRAIHSEFRPTRVLPLLKLG